MEDFTYPQKLEYKIIPHFVMIRMPIVMLILETKFALARTRGIVMLIKNNFVLELLGVCKVFHLRTICLSQCRHVYFDHGVPSWLGSILETLLDQQTRSMKYNLIFENIPEVIPNTDMKEDTQQILRDFLQSELEIVCLSQCRHVYFDHGVPSWLGSILAVFR
jgi:hypothetical protein